MKITADKLIELDIADEIIPEPFGGAQRDYDAAADNLAAALEKQLEELEKFSGEELADQRYAKFRAIGRYVEVAEENGAES